MQARPSSWGVPASLYPSVLARVLALPALVAALAAAPARAGDVFSKPPSPSGGVNNSSWVAPDGSDSDMYAWDDFTLPLTQTITEVRWRGGYKVGAPFGAATDFRISFFDSISGGFQPLIVVLPEDEENEITIATFHTGNNAGETPAGTAGGIAMYDYRFVLPSPVTLQGGVKYWFRVVATQAGYPDWGMHTGTGGNGSHFRYSTGAHMFQNVPNDLAFSLHARWEDAGHALAGTAGLPSLTGTGTLAAGSGNVLTLSSAPPSAAMLFVFGLTQIDVPAKGGVLVPYPLVLIALSTDAAGHVSVPFEMPAGTPAATDLVLQAWISDVLAVNGFGASNGLVGTTP